MKIREPLRKQFMSQNNIEELKKKKKEITKKNQRELNP